MPLKVVVSRVFLGAMCALVVTTRTMSMAPAQAGGRQSARAITVPDGTWSDLVGRIGPYGGIYTADDARQMTGDGLGLTLLSVSAAPVLSALRQGGAKYIDEHLWRIVYNVCLRRFDLQRAAGQPLACVISALDEDAIVKQANAYVNQIGSDPGLVGFWILDDYPRGDIRATLARLRDIVQRNNAATGYRRPTLCGVGGDLDYKQTLADPFFIQDRRYTEQAMQNLSPAACDIVSPYFYGAASQDDPRLVDWSMRTVMPYFREGLQRRGFDLSTTTIVPVAHAFSYRGTTTYYVTPRADDIATQMQAYCDAGAASMLFFTWQSQDAERNYKNDQSVRDGVRLGRAGCLRTWRSAALAR